MTSGSELKHDLLWRAVLVPLSLWFAAQCVLVLGSTLTILVSSWGESSEAGWYELTAAATAVLEAVVNGLIAACLWSASRADATGFQHRGKHLVRAAWLYACSALLLGIGFDVVQYVYVSQTFETAGADTGERSPSLAGYFFSSARVSAALLHVISAALAIWLARRTGRAVSLRNVNRADA